jgi:hypothetical protein
MSTGLYPNDALGHLVLLGVNVQLEDVEDEEEDMVNIDIYVWTPNELLEKDKHLRCTYYECMNGCSWDDWTTPFRAFMTESMCETGSYEPVSTWENVRLDDERIQVAYVDPLNKDYSKRCLDLKSR